MRKIPAGRGKSFCVQTGGVNLTNPYGALEITGLPKDAVVKVYADEEITEKPILTSAPAGEDQTVV